MVLEQIANLSLGVIRVLGSSPSRTANHKETNMPMYETKVKTPTGEQTERVYAPDAQEAKKLLEQKFGPRNVPFIPHMVPH
jgi:hypothetical protein